MTSFLNTHDFIIYITVANKAWSKANISYVMLKLLDIPWRVNTYYYNKIISIKNISIQVNFKIQAMLFRAIFI